MGQQIYHTIKEIMEHADKAYGSSDAIRYLTGKNTTESKTYHQIHDDSIRIANAIEQFGQQGKHIALIGPASYRWIAAYFGIVDYGSVAVPLDMGLPADELCELINRADVTMLFADEIRKDVIEAARMNCPDLKYIISLSGAGNDTIDIGSLLEKYEPVVKKEVTIEPERVCTIMFTSGTTGKSKGVVLTHRNLAENATCMDMNLAENSIILSVLPIHHAYCLCMDILKGFSLGSVICINDSLMHMAKNIKLFKPQIMLMVPLMIESIAKKLEAAKGMPALAVKEKVFGLQFQTIFSGGAYLNPDYIDLFAGYGINLLQGYGMTECSPVIATTVPGRQKKDSVGELLPNCRIRIVDNELWVSGSSVMKEYYKMPQQTNEIFEDGWLKTGDLGYIDEDGYVYLTGRRKNLIITKNGENVSPEEIENKLGINRLVQEILVREADGSMEAEIFPDKEYALAAGITDINTALQTILDTYNKTAPSYKRIYSLKIRNEEFPKTASRKIKRQL